MNFWKRWIGAIQSKTGDLSLAEMGAYDRLLDHYYSKEQPLPGDIDKCCRIARAMTKDERRAVERVLCEFFALGEDGLYRQARTEEEIAEAQPKIDAAKANGKKGGRPIKNPTKTKQKPNGLLACNPGPTQSESSTETEIKTTSLRSVTPKAPKGAEGFEAFYAAYPRKVKPKDARKAWDKLKPDGALRLTILKAIEAQKRTEQWQKDGGQFIPYPASWLNSESWLNETQVETFVGGGDEAAKTRAYLDAEAAGGAKPSAETMRALKALLPSRSVQ